MNSIRNQVQLIGHLGQDAELIKFENGKNKVNASIATSEFYKNQKGEKIEETQWHKLVAWGKTAEIMGMYFKKGKQVAVSGKLCHRTYQDKEGKDRRVTEIQVNEFTFLDKKSVN